MNISYSPTHVGDLPRAVFSVDHQFPRALIYFLIPTELFYFSIYFKLKGFQRLYKYLSCLAVFAFWLSHAVAPITCGPIKCLQNFAVAIGTMKVLDVWARRDSFPMYTADSHPPDWLLPLIIITELRYESFTPNHVRVPKSQENFDELGQLGIHLLAFAILQSLPQNYPTILALEVLLAIYIMWTTLQLTFRYKSSPALFGPLYLADSLTGFWSETWHNAFAAPCTSLAYKPLREGLPKLGFPAPVARSAGVLGAFALMAVFHMYALYPMISPEALRRVGIFFFLNGVATVSEAFIWGHKRHWSKAFIAWVFQLALASWTAEAAHFPNGLSRISWGDVCDLP